jgi:hypothetical protein
MPSLGLCNHQHRHHDIGHFKELQPHFISIRVHMAHPDHRLFLGFVVIVLGNHRFQAGTSVSVVT